jgi:hypothetical protein
MCPYSLGRGIGHQLGTDPGIDHAVERPFDYIGLERELVFQVLYAEGKSTIA